MLCTEICQGTLMEGFRVINDLFRGITGEFLEFHIMARSELNEMLIS